MPGMYPRQSMYDDYDDYDMEGQYPPDMPYYDPEGRPGREGDMPLPTVTLPEGVDMSRSFGMEEWERPKRRKKKKGKFSVIDFIKGSMAPAGYWR